MGNHVGTALLLLCISGATARSENVTWFDEDFQAPSCIFIHRPMAISPAQIGEALALADTVEIYMGAKPTFWASFKNGDIITTQSRPCTFVRVEERVPTFVRSLTVTFKLGAAFHYQEGLGHLPAFQGGPDYKYSLAGQGVSAIFREKEIEAKQ